MAYTNNLRYLITGGCGQLGPVLAKFLRSAVGRNNVIVSDIRNATKELADSGPFTLLDVTDEERLSRVIKENKITSVVHFAALLSAVAEKKLPEAFKVNVNTLNTLFMLAKNHNLQLFIPSTIGAFGLDSPLYQTPDTCVQRPDSIYGVSKVYCERLGEYFSKVHGVDFRCLRYPGIISTTQPGGGSVSYAVDVFFQAIKTKSYECYLEANTRVPFAYIDDAMQNTVKFLLTPQDKLTRRVYNYSAFSLTPEELFEAIKKTCIPDLKVTYKIDPLRQRIAGSWPKSLDCDNAIADWNMENFYDVEKAASKVYNTLK